MQQLINLIFNTIDSLITAFTNMQILGNGFTLFDLLLITGIVIAIADVFGRLSR